MHKTRTERLEEEISKLLNQYLDINADVTAENFRGVALGDLYIFEPLAEKIILVYDIEASVDGIIGNLCEDSVPQLI